MKFHTFSRPLRKNSKPFQNYFFIEIPTYLLNSRGSGRNIGHQHVFSRHSDPEHSRSFHSSPSRQSFSKCPLVTPSFFCHVVPISVQHVKAWFVDAQGMTKQAPPPSIDLFIDVVDANSFFYLFVADMILPSDEENSSQAPSFKSPPAFNLLVRPPSFS